MKSNLDNFTILHPKVLKLIKSKSYLFSTKIDYNDIMFELQINKNALVEFKLVNTDSILNLNNPNVMYLCKNNIEEEKYIYLPYMTNFHILYGDIEIYDINKNLLNSLDDLYNENYMKNYSNDKRYDDYFSLKDEQSFYKVKCKTNSLIKFEDAFQSYIDKNITINSDSKKLILDFSKYNKKIISFISDLNLYIGIFGLTELNENWCVNFSINNQNYSLNSQNNTFFKEFRNSDILIIEKPDINIHVYIKNIYNYTIQPFRKLISDQSGIFIFERNITEEYNTIIYLTDTGYSNSAKYSFFYGDPKNYEYNQLINFQTQISNNPYKYLKVDDKNKYFFLIYQIYSGQNKLNIIRIRERNITLNKLNCIENYENEEIKLNLPKIIDEKKIAFVQYFGKYVDMYYNEKIIKEEYLGNKFDVYIFDKDIEPYGIREIVTPYKAYFYISYFSFKDYTDNLTKIPKNCGFKISKTDDSLNKIIIDFDTICDKTMYKYYVFIDYNISKYKEFNLIELYYEKDINKDIKY
jgi:hypothetical protein